MLIIQRYYLREFLKVVAVLATGLSLVFSIIELVNKIDDFLPYNPSFITLFLYVVYSIPRYLRFLLPIAVLLGGLFVFSQANKKEEITAIKAAGGRIKAILKPFFITGVLISVFSFVLFEFIAPKFSQKASKLKDTMSMKDKNVSYQEGTLWLRTSDDSIMKIGLYMPEKKLSKNISIFKTAGGTLKERIEAEEAEYTKNESGNDVWKLKNVVFYDMQKSSLKKYKELEYPAMESLKGFTKDVQKPEDMGMVELFKYSERLEKAGYKNVRLSVDLNSKFSYPIINFFMVLLGIALPMRSRISGGLVTAAVGIGVCLVYWFTYTMTLSFGYSGIIPPLVAAWLVPTIFGFVSVSLLRKIHE